MIESAVNTSSHTDATLGPGEFEPFSSSIFADSFVVADQLAHLRALPRARLNFFVVVGDIEVSIGKFAGAVREPGLRGRFAVPIRCRIEPSPKLRAQYRLDLAG